jgi:hypothetical protein
LVASYRPAYVSGLPWYRGYEAARLRNDRAKAKRPIFYLRILGEFDGPT